MNDTSISVGKLARQMARDLRKNPTTTEALLWKKLGNKKLSVFLFHQGKRTIMYDLVKKNRFAMIQSEFFLIGINLFYFKQKFYLWIEK